MSGSKRLTRRRTRSSSRLGRKHAVLEEEDLERLAAEGRHRRAVEPFRVVAERVQPQPERIAGDAAAHGDRDLGE